MKKHLLPLLKGLLFSSLGAWGLFAILAIPAALVVSLMNGNTTIPIFITMLLAYPISFYFLHARKRAFHKKSIASNEYHFIKSLYSYLKGEGKFLLIAYTVFAIIYSLLQNDSKQNPVCFVLQMYFPLTLIWNHKILPIIFSWLLTSLLSFLLVSLSQYRAWRYWYIDAGVTLTDKELSNARSRHKIYLNHGQRNNKQSRRLNGNDKP